MRVYFDSRDKYFKSPFGAVSTDSEVVFRIKVWEPIKSLKCFIALWKDNEKIEELEMEKESENDGITYKAIIKTPKIASLLWYHFTLQNFEEKYYYADNDKRVGGIGKLTGECPISYQLTVYENDIAPNWFKGGIVYQIFPDRFFRGSDYEKCKKNTLEKIKNKNHGKNFVENWYKTPRYKREANGDVLEHEFYGGTLKGIEEKLSYIKSLGVTAIYLNPIFEARSSHRYDTGDYTKIDSMLGDEKSFKELVEKAKEYGISIILDGVFSHQGADSVYFNKYNNYDSIGAYNSKDSKYFEWYNFINYPDEYESWWGVKDLPNTKEMTKSYLDFICKSLGSVIKKWMKTGIAGFRLDVVDELPDEFVKEIRIAMDKVKNDNILIGEVWEDATNKISYGINRKYYINKSLKSVTNYPFMRASINFMKGKISSENLSDHFYSQMENYPKEYFDSNVNMLDSHDRVRVITELSDAPMEKDLSDEEKYNYNIDRNKYYLAISRLKALSVLQYTVPGVPMLYYGDEVGVSGYSDPYNRKPYPWGNEDKNLLEHYIALGKMRYKSKVFKEGTFRTIYCGKNAFGFERAYKNEKVYVIINRGIFNNEGERVEINIEDGVTKAIDLMSDEVYDVRDGKICFDVSPLGYKVIKVEGLA